MRLLPPRTSSDGTKLRLLETALELFAQRGYHGVSVRDITAALGIKPSALYAHAPSKQHLLAELSRVGYEELRDELRDALLRSGDEPRNQLREYVAAYVKVMATYPLLGLVMNNDLHALSPDNLRDATRSRVELSALLRAIIDRGLDAGDFDVADATLAVNAIAGMGLRIAAWYRPPGHEPSAASDSYPADVRELFLGRDYSIEELQSTFADYALRICGAKAEAG